MARDPEPFDHAALDYRLDLGLDLPLLFLEKRDAFWSLRGLGLVSLLVRGVDREVPQRNDALGATVGMRRVTSGADLGKVSFSV